MDNYSLGQYKICGKTTSLKNGICSDCQEKNDLPDFFKDLFRKD